MFFILPHDAFIKISGMVFNLQSEHEYIVKMAIVNRNGCVQCSKSNNSKSRKSELLLISSARRLRVLYNTVKFRENISDGIKVMERIRMIEALTDGRTLKNSEGIT